MSDTESHSSVEPEKIYVVKNSDKKQKPEKPEKSEKFKENIKKASAKRAELKPYYEETRKNETELKTLARLVKAKESRAKVELLKKRLVELDEYIANATDAKTKQPLKVPLATTETPPPKNKRPNRKVRNIVVEDLVSKSTVAESENETEVENIVLKRKAKGRPRTNQQPKPETPDIKKLALKDAIRKQTDQMLYQQLFGGY
jgi:hypothetical protein